MMSHNVDDEVVAAEAYERVLPELKAIPAGNVTRVNLDVPQAIATGLGALPKIAVLLPAMKRELPQFDDAQLTKAEDYAFTLTHTNARYLSALRPRDELRELLGRGMAARGLLNSDVATLRHRGLLDPQLLSAYTGAFGYKPVASDLQLLSTVLEDNWDRIEGQCAIDKSELTQAARLAAHILRLVGLREQAPLVAAEWSDNRARAFTLYTRCYDELRRAVTYLRWHDGDIDEIAPSLYGPRKRRSAVAANANSAPVDSATGSSDKGLSIFSNRKQHRPNR